MGRRKLACLLLTAATMIVGADCTRPTWLSYLAGGRFKRHICRLFAPVTLGLLSSGCTLVGYVSGNAARPAPQSFPPQSARAIPRGTEVEVFYLPRASAQAPRGATCLDAPPSDRGDEFSVATGAYAGIQGDELVLNQTVSRAAVASHETYDSSTDVSFDTVRVVVPLEQVSLIRTKPSSTPAVVGAVLGAAMDVATVVFWARAVRNVD